MAKLVKNKATIALEGWFQNYSKNPGAYESPSPLAPDVDGPSDVSKESESTGTGSDGCTKHPAHEETDKTHTNDFGEISLPGSTDGEVVMAAPGVEGGIEGTEEFIYYEADIEKMLQLVPLVDSLSHRVQDLEEKLNMIQNPVSLSSSCYASDSLKENTKNIGAEKDELESRNNKLENLSEVSKKYGRQKLNINRVLENPDDKKERFPCTLCGKTYANKKSLVRHFEHHVGTYSCQNCSRKYDRKENLTLHQKKRCGERKRKGIPLH